MNKYKAALIQTLIIMGFLGVVAGLFFLQNIL